jgi:hypothetical protein
VVDVTVNVDDIVEVVEADVDGVSFIVADGECERVDVRDGVRE